MFVGTSARENQEEMDSVQLQSLRSFYCFFGCFWIFLGHRRNDSKFESFPIETTFTMNWHRGHGAGARAAMLKGLILSCAGKKKSQKKSTKNMICALFYFFFVLSLGL